MKYIKFTKNFICLLLVSFFITGIFSYNTEAKKDNDSENKFTGHWQYTDSQIEVPSCGYVLLGYARDTSKVFYGSLNSTDSNKITNSLENNMLQIDDETKEAFMLIQNNDCFHIRLSNNKYIKITGDLTNAYLEETDKVEEAASFRIEMNNHSENGHTYYRIFVPMGLSDLSLTVTDGNISVSSSCYSGFYILAEATKIKTPPFGDNTRIVRFIVIMIVTILIVIMLYLYSKNILNLISFGITSICSIALLVFFMIFAITTEQPGLYVLHQSTFNKTEIKPLEDREPHKSYYDILEDGSAIFTFGGEEGKAYVWKCSITDENVFTSTTSGKYSNGLYTIWLRPFQAGIYDVEFYYYDMTKDLSTSIESKAYRIEVNENNQIVNIEQKSGEI